MFDSLIGCGKDCSDAIVVETAVDNSSGSAMRRNELDALLELLAEIAVEASSRMREVKSDAA